MDRESNASTSVVRSHAIGAWISRKRIVISLISFSCLIIYNLLVLRTQTFDPLNFRQPQALLGTSLVLFGIGIRSWSAGILRKSEVLVTTGPYALVRNPLYVGSFLMMIGFCWLMRDRLAMAFVVGPMAIVYWFQIMVEESRLASRFREHWSIYARNTGRLIPRTIDSNIFMAWSLNQWLKNREYQACLVSIIGLLALHWI